MSKKRGLSVEEKRTRMMEFFYEKEILTSLVDDGMVDTDKIGTCVYFWAFPSKASQNRKRKLGELKTQYNSGVKRLKTTEERLVKAKVGKEETDSRAEILSNLNKCKELQAELSAELDKYRECDPEVMQRMKDETVVAKEAANRWTDNIFSIKSWIKNKFCFEDSVIDKQFGIPEDFDYLE